MSFHCGMPNSPIVSECVDNRSDFFAFAGLPLRSETILSETRATSILVRIRKLVLVAVRLVPALQR
jgi:hypothetical protein